MVEGRESRIKALISCIPKLTDGQMFWIERIAHIFDSPRRFELLHSDTFDNTTIENFGDALRIHHCFSAEPFSKDKFEYVLEKILNMSGHSAKLAPKGTPGHDITIDRWRVSLKTQADKNIKKERIWISKFMELGKGQWGDNPEDLKGLRRNFIEHLKKYDRIFTLRALSREPNWYYELVEIPKQLMELAETGTLKMMTESKQYPKPGYCYVKSDTGQAIYELYFDAGSERKLQVKNLPKSRCTVHATWEFTIPSK